MSTAVLDRRVDTRRLNGGTPARRAVVRWGVRLFRREWRQQLLILALLTVAVAATTTGVAAATNTVAANVTTFRLPASDQKHDADIAAIQATFGRGDVFVHR